MPSTIPFERFDVLTFDCFGTLVDWESGLLTGLRAILDRHGVTPDDEDLLARYAVHESALESGPYLPYREVLARAADAIARELGVTASADELAAFGGSVGDWPPFPDSAAALARLKQRFALAVITNCDDDLFAAANRRLGGAFDFVITAQQCRSYKPDPHNFEVAFERIDRPRDRILHVAQSLFHDHVTAKSLGLTTVWINRRHDKPGEGATPPANATPDLIVPDMATFAELATS